MRIRIDKALCIAAGSCVEIAPRVFQIGEDRKAYVVDPNGADEDTIFEAAESCPTLAITLEDENGKLKRLLADAMLDTSALRELLAKIGKARRQARGCRLSEGSVSDEREPGLLGNIRRSQDDPLSLLAAVGTSTTSQVAGTGQ